MAIQKVVHIITRLDRGGSARNTMLTALGHDRSHFEPVVITGQTGSWDAQGGRIATIENLWLLEKESIRHHIVASLVRHLSPLSRPESTVASGWLLREERPISCTRTRPKPEYSGESPHGSPEFQ